MATIVFNAIGTALGGPVGGAIGALAGRQLDAVLLGPGAREGPRLRELAITASSYGQPLPRHYGRMRVAGSVIWATDLVEHSETQGGGKGAPAVTTYSYTANFAVALSSRPILGLGRIWADGRLLRGGAGDLKAGGTLRVHTGAGDQSPDPLILAAEGAARCPAFRDLAYVVFEDLDLSDFHNHIPALTFEVIADEDFDLGAVIGDAIGDAIGDVDAAVALPGVAGWSAEGPPADSLAALGQVLPLEIDAGAEQVVIAPARLREDAVMLAEAAAAAGTEAFGGASGHSRQRAPRADRPPAVLRYFDTTRDYQPGVQRAIGRAGTGEPATIELPAALAADAARALVETTARRLDWSRDRLSWRTAVLDPAVTPGATVAAPGVNGLWRVRAWEWNADGVEIGLERIAPAGADSAPALAADPGSTRPPPDVPAGATALVAFELPTDGTGPDRPRPFAAVSSPSAGWSGAALFADHGDGQLHPLGPSGRARSVIGTVSGALPPASPLLLDRGSAAIVTLVDPAMALVPAGMEQLAAGANLALIGNEIVQFARATALGSGTWRLEALLRGRGGTEGAIGGHAAGEAFVLLDARPVPLDAAVLGTAAGRQVVALGRGDAEPVGAPVLLDGVTLRPLAPVHPRRAVLADGTWRLAWTRRARGAWTWRDGVDVPLAEQSESYVVTLGAPEAPAALWTVAAPRLEIGPALLAALAADHPGATLRVRQQGTHALSGPLRLCDLP